MDNPVIKWQNLSGEKCLSFIFKGKFTKENAVSAIDKWREAFELYPDKKITLIWYCLELESYDSDARSDWQIALKNMKDGIDRIFLVTNSNLIKMGASVISLFASYSICVVNSEEDIKIK